MNLEPIVFEITPHDTTAHLFRIKCRLPRPHSTGQRFLMPSWVPGSYLIREFARNVVAIRAMSKTIAVNIVKVDKDTWQCGPCSDELAIEYDVYAWDMSIRAAFLDDRQGFFNGTSVFLRPEGFENHPYEVKINSASTDVRGDWALATSLMPLDVDHNGFGTYRSDNYEDLVDHPVHMGAFDSLTFDVRGVQHRLVVTGKHRGDLQRLQSDLQILCAQHVQLFGQTPPFDRYLFLLRVEDDAYGGLEHRASSALLCKRSDLPQTDERNISEGYRTLLGLFSHEYFHAWNVKRMRPKGLVPLDFNRENYTKLLWFFEGFTSYYDDLMLLRSKLVSPASYLELLGRTISRVWRGRGRFKQSLAESSFDTWIKFYRPDENSPNAVVSYYTKGSLAALALDLTIRHASDHKRSLDDVMKLLWNQSAAKNADAPWGLDEDDILKAAEEVAGVSIRGFFDIAVNGTQDLPLADLFARIGIACHFRVQENDKDMGGNVGKKGVDETKALVYFGAKTKHEEGNLLAVAHIEEDSPAQKCGLAAGDVLVALDDLRVTTGNLDILLSRYRPGDRATLHAFRRGELFSTTLFLTSRSANTCFLTMEEKVSTIVDDHRQKWLHGDNA